jgi:hypothetical protein
VTTEFYIANLLRNSCVKIRGGGRTLEEYVVRIESGWNWFRIISNRRLFISIAEYLWSARMSVL